MTTSQRAEMLASALEGCRAIVPTTPEDLLGLVRRELGSEAVLDAPTPLGRSRSLAVPITPVLHVVAGNTPAAAIQSVVRGLLLGAKNLVKLPSDGLPEFSRFIDRLPAPLAALVQCRSDLPDSWIEESRAVIVFGSDETIVALRERLPRDRVFLPHGHRISFAVVFDDPRLESADLLAMDVAAFDQLGCLSPHVCYVAGDGRSYAEALATHLAQIEEAEPRAAVSVSVASAIREIREEFAFRATNGEPCTVWQSPGSTAWTVIYDEQTGFPSSPLHRTIFIKPLPQDFDAELHRVRHHLSCIGIFPSLPEHSARVLRLGASRICPIGQMQRPPWNWHQDGMSSLQQLVTWVDIEDADPEQR